MRLTLAVIASYKRAQELTFTYSGGEKSIPWCDLPFWGLDRAIVKSIWRKRSVR